MLPSQSARIQFAEKSSLNGIRRSNSELKTFIDKTTFNFIRLTYNEVQYKIRRFGHLLLEGINEMMEKGPL